jgi:hypothetical protein
VVSGYGLAHSIGCILLAKLLVLMEEVMTDKDLTRAEVGALLYEATNQLDSAMHSVDVLEKRVAYFMAENARLREAIDYVLDGMAISAPDYEIDPDDDFLDAANSKWVCDTLTHLAAALTGDSHD